MTDKAMTDEAATPTSQNRSSFPDLIPPPSVPSQESLRKVQGETPQGKTELVPSERIGEVLIFCVLALLGGGLWVLIALTDLLWIYPATFYGTLIYVAWLRYFSY